MRTAGQSSPVTPAVLSLAVKTQLLRLLAVVQRVSQQGKETTRTCFQATRPLSLQAQSRDSTVEKMERPKDKLVTKIPAPLQQALAHLRMPHWAAAVVHHKDELVMKIPAHFLVLCWAAAVHHLAALLLQGALKARPGHHPSQVSQDRMQMTHRT